MFLILKPLAAWKISLESHGLFVKVDKTKILVSNAEHDKISVINPKYPCVVCTFGVGANSISCTLHDLWIHNKCSGKTDHLNDNRNFASHKCSSNIAPAPFASFKEVNIRNDSFHVESTFKYLGDASGQCGGCSDTLSSRIASSWKALQELLPILTNNAIWTKPRGKFFNMCVRKVILFGSKTWPVVTEDVQQLVTADWYDQKDLWKDLLLQIYCTLVSVVLMTQSTGTDWGSMGACYIWMICMC